MRLSVSGSYSLFKFIVVHPCCQIQACTENDFFCARVAVIAYNRQTVRSVIFQAPWGKALRYPQTFLREAGTNRFFQTYRKICPYRRNMRKRRYLHRYIYSLLICIYCITTCEKCRKRSKTPRYLPLRSVQAYALYRKTEAQGRVCALKSEAC